MEILKDITKTEIGWIAPDGEVWGYSDYIYGSSDHEKIAAQIAQDHGYQSSVIERYGYVKYSLLRVAKSWQIYVLSDEQRLKILEFMRAKNLTEIGLGSPNNKRSLEQIESMSASDIDYAMGGIMFSDYDYKNKKWK